MSDFVMNVEAYLNRLGLSGPLEPTEENLCILTRAHLEKIPFENLEALLEDRIPSLAPHDLYRKVVEERRGGWCFELNKLFYLLLKSIGYDCMSVPARVVYRAAEPRGISHRATMVTVGGRKWLVDVGYGGAGPKGALRVDTDAVQNIHGDNFFVEQDQPDYPGERAIFRLDDGVSTRIMTFRELSWLDADFETLNRYYSVYTQSPFKMRVILYRCTADGWVSLNGDRLTICSGSQQQIVELQTKDQVQEAIRQYFDLIVSLV